MAGNAALLIDLENFFIGREQNHQRAHPDETYEFPVDLDSLCAFAKSIAGGRRLTVSRAYANFNDRRTGAGEKRWDYYLQPLPRFLMEQGIEPVQVFRFPGGNNKNAADMKMAMDATVLLQAPSAVDFFVLVTGDSDFIPLVLELKRSGAQVFVIGVSHCTKPIFERYCDRFEYFEDLLAAREMKRGDKNDLFAVKAALATLVSSSTPIKFAAVKPLLSDELGFRFDPTRFGSESTGEFLRKNAAALGIAIRRAEHDWEIAGPWDGAGVAGAAERALGGDLENGSSDAPDSIDSEGGSWPADDLSARSIDDPGAALGNNGGGRAVRRVSAASPPKSEVQTAELYRDLLRQGVPRCYVVEYDDWNRIVDTVFEIAAGPEGGPVPRIVHPELLAEVTELCSEKGMVEASRKVRDACFQLFKSGCFLCADESADEGKVDFHWSKPARLDPAIQDVDGLVERAWTFLYQLLAKRLDQRGLSAEPQIEPLIELFGGVDPTDEDVALIRSIAAPAHREL